MARTGYVLTVGTKPPVEMQDDLGVAMDRTYQAIKDLPFEPWRKQAVEGVIANMPRNGTSFMARDGTIVRIERRSLA